MKLNPECIRDLLIAIEKNVLIKNLSTETLFFEEMCNLVNSDKSSKKSYAEDDIAYTSIMLSQGGFADIYINYAGDSINTIIYGNLTYSGHEFLNNIRSDNVWNKTKAVAGKIGVFSIHALKDLSIQIVSELIKSSLGLS